MTSKKSRQRGSRTHGGGTHKNRRGAGNRGGRGNAGRDKHQIHGQDPLGKHGFSRPQDLERDTKEISLRSIDEDVGLWAAEGRAEETDFGYRVDVRDVVEDGHEADVVKVLGSGQVRHQLAVVADAFTENARAAIEEAGGDAELSERAKSRLDAQAAAEEGDAETENIENPASQG